MNARKLFADIDLLYPEYLEFWKKICMMETPTADKQRIDHLGTFLKEKAGFLGWEIVEHREESAGNALCFIMNPEAPGIPVCFSAHMDTVHPPGSFGETPVHEEETYLCGPGVADCKGGIAAGFLAMHALQLGGYSDRPVKLILQSDEEVNSRFSRKRTVDFMIRMAEGSSAFLNLETTSPVRSGGNGTEDGSGSAVLSRKGILTFHFQIYGKAVHSARCQNGVSAVAEAAHKILELEKMKEDQGLTCSCSMIAGGTASNVVPDSCSFTADIRFADSVQMEEAKCRVEEIAATSFIPGSTCRAELISWRSAMEYEKRNEDLLEKMNAIYRKEGMPYLKACSSAGGSDAADVSRAGIPTVDSIGVRGSGIHSVEEKAEMASLAECAKRIAVIALELP